MSSKFFCLLVCSLYLLPGRSQAILSRIINQYVSVTAIDTCQNGVRVSGTLGLQPGMQAILIQMKGASIDVEESPNFGNITELGSAGLYEKVIIRTIEGNLITFQNQLLNKYEVMGVIQLVSMPVFDHAIVRERVQAKPWDGATGGIIAFDVRETLRLEADIDASGAGFRGGQANIQDAGDCSFAVNIRDYGRPIGDWRGAAKGEGVAHWLTGLEAGRGAQANGGGGGNDHNSGGGGGSNITRGGRGGRNAEPSFFGCKGNFPGDGGKAISADTTRLYLGGGGGAGDENNDVATDGGAGGGIIILSVKTLTANGFGLFANGYDGSDTGGDGAGGGGGGGTIVIKGEQLTDILAVEVRGGKGGDIDNRNQDRCHGAGGGGGGGRYLGPFEWNLAVDLSYSGGDAGISTNSSAGSCGNADNLALRGEEGIRQDKGNLAESLIPFAAPSIVSVPEQQMTCEGGALMLPVEVEGASLQFQWQVLEGNEYVDVSAILPYSGIHTAQLHIDPIPGGLMQTSYRLQVTTGCNDLLYSDPINLIIGELPEAGFSFMQDEFMVALNNQSSGADSITWFLGDGNRSDEENPVHHYNENGEYEITQIAHNNCGADTSRQLLSIDVGIAPSAAFSFTPVSGCNPLQVQFTNESIGDYTNVLWKFPGGEPDISTEPNPVVNYEQAGIYTFILVLSGETGIDSLVLEEELNIFTPPLAAFEFTIADRTVTFQNHSTGAETYRWLFGDGAEEERITPEYTYQELGEYEVALIAGNECGQDTLRRSLLIGQAPQAQSTYNPTGGCGAVKVQFSNQSTGDYTSVKWDFPGGTPATSTDQNPEVTYFEPGVYGFTMSVEGSLGNDQVEIENAIEILPIPEPAFTYELKGDTLILQNNSTDAQSYLWNFGDEETSREENPIHVFGQGGSFNVTLNASNAYCGKSASQMVHVVITNTEETLRAAGISLYPNPLKDWLHIDIEKADFAPLSITLVNSLGQRMEGWTLYFSQSISLENYPSGLYYVQIQSERGEWVSRVVKR